ncbi:MAG TPA: hypothetical protein VF091_01820 [Gaiellaceae bacterium]
MRLRPRPYPRPRSLVRLRSDALALRLVAPNGELMATHLRAMTLRDALERPFFIRRRG